MSQQRRELGSGFLTPPPEAELVRRQNLWRSSGLKRAPIDTNRATRKQGRDTDTNRATRGATRKQGRDIDTNRATRGATRKQGRDTDTNRATRKQGRRGAGQATLTL
ncbi:hypothetical protein BA895_09915 [Humibacillus sp. DSM 29435]|uniref:hypothetical protein n=1 Tax=Humibacillus sp. DSM 29435 TaxID=1869167 RepID=UPI00087246EC|nr:hypothetical protein [Humibacillus sp. DSM 29435]OFE14654.1 hypothetical protein BA895_09915 [Humibacillus sp. DSM 29435]